MASVDSKLTLEFEDSVQAWEHLKHPIMEKDSAAFLIEAGRHGWELIQVMPCRLQAPPNAIEVPGQMSVGQVVEGLMIFMKRPMKKMEEDKEKVGGGNGREASLN